ncbi:MAG TPA: hypothetical protein VKQ54_15490 [Caulobacteraceae bacterium]|nr:hypothetical protein [Caulobacteraceae bacterium]
MVAMMAIGDSLFNGVRSLTIKEELAQWSAPAQVARALGIPFATPDYPRYVVVNFEQWLHDFPQVFTSMQDLERNIAFWDATPKSSLPAFDNIAIASARYADLYTRTWQTADAEIAALHAALGTGFTQPNARLADMFFAFNTRFLLNPTGDPNTPPQTPLEIVADRGPARLLVNIGPNNGLWNMGFGAVASSGLGNPTGGPFDADDVVDLKALVAHLGALPPAVEHIYVNAMPLPSDVADMMPFPDTSDTHKPGAGAYYPTYENSIGFNYGTLTAAQQRANDDLVSEVNALVAQEARPDPRIHIVPIDQAFKGWDFKTDPDAQHFDIDGKVISNLMIQSGSLPLPHPWRGGLMGLDGMHPTILGYAVMAQEILKSIQQYEGVAAPAPIDLKRAYQADSLLQRLPSLWEAFFVLQLEIRRLTGRGPNSADFLAGLMPTSDLHKSVTQLFEILQFKID